MIPHTCNPAQFCALCAKASDPSAAKPCGKPDCGCGCTDKALAVHLAHAGGLGDSVCGLYAACGLADATGRAVRFHTRHPDWFGSVSHPGVSILGDARDGADLSADYDGQLLAAASGSCPSRVQWYCDRAADAFHLPAFQGRRPAEVRQPEPVIGIGYTLLAPFSAHQPREWPGEKWRELARSLRRDGTPVVVLGAPGHGDRLQSLFAGVSCVWYWGQPAAWVCAAVANAGSVVGNDSGLAHLAGLFGVPTVAVMTHLRPSFVFDPACSPSVVGVGADPAAWPCQGCAWRTGYGYRSACNAGCGALASIETSAVRRAARG